ncbi:hypothetical protein AX774_g2432 [Zancudomyces culisetae]|uniref:Uncharacterized protein n=1 Tax=Zancudomyces culisetae TaxID=1213189 RepID=A0A1R1PST3_ZANCU|nr:hypothetical protein AX774_g2432 [Zancudomyces culisetae]|eukprot:OMH84056.1 hypothetical protein AX774_g2432 [Zancudomyces culisetae]
MPPTSLAHHPSLESETPPFETLSKNTMTAITNSYNTSPLGSSTPHTPSPSSNPNSQNYAKVPPSHPLLLVQTLTPAPSLSTISSPLPHSPSPTSGSL